MRLLPIPDAMKENIYQISPELFTKRGIRLILLDIDNTVAPYTVADAAPSMISWVRRMEQAGLTLHILSNNRGTRPEHFAAALGLRWRKRANKPFPAVARRVIAGLGYTPAETAFIGDQLFADVWCAKNCGAFSVLVEPIELHRPLLRLRYRLEHPFRCCCRRIISANGKG